MCNLCAAAALGHLPPLWVRGCFPSFALRWTTSVIAQIFAGSIQREKKSNDGGSPLLACSGVCSPRSARCRGVHGLAFSNSQRGKVQPAAVLGASNQKQLAGGQAYKEKEACRIAPACLSASLLLVSVKIQIQMVFLSPLQCCFPHLLGGLRISARCSRSFAPLAV